MSDRQGFYVGYCERCGEAVYTSTVDLHPALGGHVVTWKPGCAPRHYD